MKQFTKMMAVVVLAASTISCKKDIIGRGPITTETRSITGFKGIDLRMNGNVYYTNATAWKVEIAAPQSLFGSIETYLVDQNLVVKYSNGRTYDADDRIRINVSGPDVSRFMLNTSGSIYSTNDIQVPALFLRSNGSGNISLQNVITNSIDAEGTVSGSISATGGTTVSAQIKSDASADVNLQGIIAKSVSARTVGSGDIRIRVTEHLDATINGSGSIYYTGYPSVSPHISGSGHLVRY